MFVDNLPEFTPVYWLRETCSRYRTVADAFIPKSRRRGKRKCFGFVRFKEERITMKCIDALNRCSAMSRRIVMMIVSWGWSQRRNRSGLESIQHQARSIKDDFNKAYLPCPNKGGDYGINEVRGARSISGYRSLVGIVKRVFDKKEAYMSRKIVMGNSKWLARSLSYW